MSHELLNDFRRHRARVLRSQLYALIEWLDGQWGDADEEADGLSKSLDAARTALRDANHAVQASAKENAALRDALRAEHEARVDATRAATAFRKALQHEGRWALTVPVWTDPETVGKEHRDDEG